MQKKLEEKRTAGESVSKKWKKERRKVLKDGGTRDKEIQENKMEM